MTRLREMKIRLSNEEFHWFIFFKSEIPHWQSLQILQDGFMATDFCILLLYITFPATFTNQNQLYYRLKSNQKWLDTIWAISHSHTSLSSTEGQVSVQHTALALFHWNKLRFLLSHLCRRRVLTINWDHESNCKKNLRKKSFVLFPRASFITGLNLF